jgi:putative endopeptidase
MRRATCATGGRRRIPRPSSRVHRTSSSRRRRTKWYPYEVVPGKHLNGELSSGENLADIGGLTLAYDALGKYLNAHPKENRRIDGLTPQQRCFVAWAQNWADKKQPGMLKQEALTDGHPPGSYRMFAPAQDVPGFYATFGIKPGDRMWVDPKDRVSIW